MLLQKLKYCFSKIVGDHDGGHAERTQSAAHKQYAVHNTVLMHLPFLSLPDQTFILNIILCVLL